MLALLLPTRNKPEELERIIKEFSETTTNAKLLFYVATDDPQIDAYRRISERTEPENVYAYIGEPLGFSRAINFLASHAFSMDGVRIAMRCEDDFYFVKKGWDEHYLAMIPQDGVAMVWCNYVLKDERAEPHTGAITKKWYEAVGYFSLPGCRHYFCDNALLELAKALGRAIHIREPYVDHRYVPSDPRKKANFKEGSVYEEDAKVYHEWLNGEGFKKDVEKLKSQL